MGNHFWCKLLNHSHFLHNFLKPQHPCWAKQRSGSCQMEDKGHLSFHLCHNSMMWLPRMGNAVASWKNSAYTHNHISVTGSVCCMCVYPHHSHGIFPSCLVTMSHESDVEHYVHQLKKKKKNGTKGWFKEEMRWNTYCSVIRVLFHHYERGELNSKGKPHQRWKLFKSFWLPSHTRDSELEQLWDHWAELPPAARAVCAAEDAWGTPCTPTALCSQ